MKKIILLLMLVFVFGICNVNAATSDIPNSSYIVGEHLFTRNAVDDYNGKLSTSLIMLASKTLSEDEKDSMVIYYKTPRGILTDALTGEEVQINEQDLMENIKYYNLKEIPTYTLESYFNDKTSKTEHHYFRLNVKYNDSDDANNLQMKWDIYGAKDWDGVIYNFPGGVTPGETNDSTLKLLGSAKLTSAEYDYTLDLNEFYSYVGFPYFEDGTNKVYLECTNDLTVYPGSSIKAEIINNEMVVSVEGIADYSIVSAEMYADRAADKEGSHIDLQDLLSVTKDNEEFYKGLTTKYVKLFDEITNLSLEGWYPAEIFFNMSEKDKATTIKLGDVGNSEKEEHNYYLTLEVYSESANRNITLTNKKNPVKGTVYQPVLAQTQDLTEMDLIYFVAFISAFTS